MSDLPPIAGKIVPFRPGDPTDSILWPSIEQAREWLEKLTPEQRAAIGLDKELDRLRTFRRSVARVVGKLDEAIEAMGAEQEMETNVEPA